MKYNAKKFIRTYKNYLEDSFALEFIHFKLYLNTSKNRIVKNNTAPLDLYKIIREDDLILMCMLKIFQDLSNIHYFIHFKELYR